MAATLLCLRMGGPCHDWCALNGASLDWEDFERKSRKGYYQEARIASIHPAASFVEGEVL
jgi:hypothetical protein